MTFTPQGLVTALGDLTVAGSPPTRFVVAFSGGLDSTALLAALVESADSHRKPISAVHVNHQMQPQAAAWAVHCSEVATRLGVSCAIESFEVNSRSGQGPEASAREARYAALSRHMQSGTWLLSAHHRDDHAETLLINLMRGSGPAGIAAIPAIRQFGAGWLARPLLSFTRESLARYVHATGLPWIDDPSNDESVFDRNFLRNEVLPLLETRWPNASVRLAKSAAFAREAVELAVEIADTDIARLGDDPSRLSVSALNEMSAARRKNLLRRAIDRLALPPVPSNQLQSIVDELLTAREDGAPLVRWGAAEARRYHDVLYLMPMLAKPDFAGRPIGMSPVDLGMGMGSIVLQSGSGRGLSRALVASGLTLELRQGGEEIRPSSQSHTKKLKKLLQEESLLPWMRDCLPLIYRDRQLVAVADLWIAEECAEANGYTVQWMNRPALK